VPAAATPFQSDPVPDELIAVSESAMPRLHSLLDQAISDLAVDRVSVSLDPAGGVEAWLLDERRLIIGAGALAVFGQAELVYLAALAISLQAHGRALMQPGEVPGFVEAAVNAFNAAPGSWAAARVLAQLDATVRGSDPAQVDAAAVLRESAAFRAIATRALEILQ
jgi:hypothetical protein